MQRYIFAVSIPSHIQEIIHTLCKRVTGHDSPVRFHHVTIIPPFFLKNNISLLLFQKLISSFSFDPFHAHLSALDHFEQHDRNILVALVEPQITFEKIYRRLQHIVASSIEIDQTPYTGGQVPTFQAHITMDYNAPAATTSHLSSITPPDQEWDVTSVELYKEVGRGIWELVPARDAS